MEQSFALQMKILNFVYTSKSLQVRREERNV